MNLKSRLNKHLAVAAVATAAVSAANAQIVHHVVNHDIPATLNGLYLNVVTGANNLVGAGGGSTVPGWDINFWSSSSFNQFSPSNPAGGAYVITAANTAANLGFGTDVGAASTFGSGSTNAGQWALNSDQNLIGFRFFNEATSAVHYGWARVSLGATLTSPRSLVEYAYESTAGASIGAGVVPAPSAVALLGLGGLVAGRRRR